jgi:hypothetical protein
MLLLPISDTVEEESYLADGAGRHPDPADSVMVTQPDEEVTGPTASKELVIAGFVLSDADGAPALVLEGVLTV